MKKGKNQSSNKELNSNESTYYSEQFDELKKKSSDAVDYIRKENQILKNGVEEMLRLSTRDTLSDDKNSIDVMAKIESVSNRLYRENEDIALELESKVSELEDAYAKALSRPDLSVEQMYEHAFKNILTEEDYKNLTKDIYEEMLKLGHYRKGDSNQKH